VLPATWAQAETPFTPANAQKYFAEAHALCQKDNGQLWGVSLCGPMMFVDPESRAVITNEADGEGQLKTEAGVYTGTLPKNVNIANTAFEWAGVRWTQIMWPLPDNERLRDTLMCHEMFHRIQDGLHLPMAQSSNNNHLDTLEGRYWFGLELRALNAALMAGSVTERQEAAADALAFRAARYKAFPEAAKSEKELEDNEGLAEYTGVRAGNASPEDQRQAAFNDIARITKAETFVRSFAYATGPAYGLLLDREFPGWRKQLTRDKGFSGLLADTLATQPQIALEDRAARYDGKALRASETAREEKRKQLMAELRRKFIEGPVLTLRLIHMNVQFDPRTLQPLDKEGTVYPTLRIVDEWGVLEVKNGALMNPNWSIVTVSAPAEAAGNSLKGDGWGLELKLGWKLIPDVRKGDWKLVAETK